MTIEECYKRIGGNYKDVLLRFGSEVRIRKFLGLFLEDTNFEQLVTALSKGSAADAFRAAHSLKGISANLSFDKLFVSSSKLTDLIRGGVITDEALLLQEEVKKDFKTIIDNVSKL